ncbi:hypothetical protein [Salinimicrobium soli]|uniref:hypothetical protein n=1 Tax=Salinimicrobium soli TaxID=1254399 RepID=UPI003AAEC8B3
MIFKLTRAKSFFVLIYLLPLYFLAGCSTDDGPSEPDTSTSNPQGLTVYKNQTGNPNADALQAHYEDNNVMIDIYGTFDAIGEPSVPKTVTVQKKNNDTIVNLVLDPFTSRIASSFISVNGERAPVVMKFSYPEVGSSPITISLYEYNWTTHTGEVFFTTTLNGETGGVQNVPGTARNNSGSSRNVTKSAGSSLDLITGVASGIVVAEIVSVIGGGWSLIPVVASTATAVAAVAVPVAIGAAIGITAIALSAILNEAGASEIVPSDLPYPNGVPVPNPVPPGEDPTPNLEVNECESVQISFSAFMDQDGTIVIRNISGGASPYSYAVNNTVQQNQIFSNDYPDDTYMISVVDGNGCVRSMLLALSRENPMIGTWKPLTWAGKALGSPVYDYLDDCPDIAIFIDYLYSQTLTFTEDTYSASSEEQYIDLNRHVDTNTCVITSDDADTTYPRETYNANGTYTFSGNILTIYYEGDPNDPEIGQIEFVNAERTQFIVVEDPYGDIYEKQ